MNDLSDYEDEGGKKKKDKKESKKDKVSYATLAGDESDEELDAKTSGGGIAKKLKTPFKLPSAKKKDKDKDKEKDKDKDKHQTSDKKSSSLATATSASTSGVSVSVLSSAIEAKDKEKKLSEKEKKLLDKERKLSDRDKEKKEKERKFLEKEKKSREEKDKKIFERKLSLEKDKDRKIVQLPSSSTSGSTSASVEKVRRPFSSSYIPSASFDHHDSPFSPSRIAGEKDKDKSAGGLNLSFNAFLNAPAPVFSRKHKDKESHKDKQDKDKDKHSKDKDGTHSKEKKPEKDHTSKVKLKLIRSTKSSFDDSRIDSPSQHLFPEDADSIAKEIKKYESLLEQTHTSIKSSKKVSKKNEEMLWELQRTLTQLKRKLRSVNILNSTVPPSQVHHQQQQQPTVPVQNSSSEISSSQIKAEENIETQVNKAAIITTTSANVVDKSTSPLQLPVVEPVSKNEDLNLKTISPPPQDVQLSESPSESLVDDEITLDFTLQQKNTLSTVSNPNKPNKNDNENSSRKLSHAHQGDQKLKKSNTTGSIQSPKSIDNVTTDISNSNLNDTETVVEREIEKVQVEVEVHNFSFDSDDSDEIQVLDNLDNKESEENEMLYYSVGADNDNDNDIDTDMISLDGETETEKEIAELTTKAQYDLHRAHLSGQKNQKNESFDLNMSIDQSQNSKSEPVELCPPPPLEQLQQHLQHASGLLEKDDTLETDESFDIDIESENIRIAKKLDFDGCYDDLVDRDDLLSSEYENDEEYNNTCNTVLYPSHKLGFLTSAAPDDIDPFEIPIFDSDDYLKVENQALREYNEGLLERIADEENEIENMMEQLMDMKNSGIDIDVPEFEYDLDDYDGNELLALWQTSKIENESLNDHVYHLRQMVAGSKLEEFKLQVRLRFLEENDQQLIISKNEGNNEQEPTLVQLDEHL